MKLSDSQVLELKPQQQMGQKQLNQMMEVEAVKQYLCDHPNFLNRNPELLTHLELNHGSDDTFSLVERQVKTLREKNQSLQGQMIDMLRSAFDNESLLNQCNQLMLRLLETNNLKELTQQTIDDIKTTFALSEVALILVGSYSDCSPAKAYASAAQLKEKLHCQFPDSQPLCGRLSESTRQALFPDSNVKLASCALVPIGEGCSQGLLALASSDVERFSPEMGTLFVEMIAKQICALVRLHGKN